jgi:predicted Zn-dependent protease
MPWLRRLVTFALVAALASPWPAAARAPLTLIRDAEIEHTIRALATPVFQAAGLDPQAVKVYLVQDKAINAFVAGGMNIFIYTGLLTKADSANQVIGVIAHETGHIAGGHLVRMRTEMENMSGAALLAALLGIAVAVGGGGSAGTGIVFGGTQVAERALLSFSRSQENTADGAALKFLDATGQSSRGLLEFMKKLEDQELLTGTLQEPYLATHPLTRERIEHIRQHVDTSPLADAPEPEDFATMFERMQGKLVGFIDPPETTLRAFKADDPSLKARIARAVALYRVPDLPEALSALDALLADYPDDAYFHELKGQVLFENGKTAEAVAAYRDATRLAPDEPLLQLGLGQALLGLQDAPEQWTEAGEHLEFVVAREPDNAQAWQLLSVAYGETGRMPLAALASAEYAYRLGRADDAAHFADRAAKGLEANTPAWLRAQDILAAVKTAPPG